MFTLLVVGVIFLNSIPVYGMVSRRLGSLFVTVNTFFQSIQHQIKMSSTFFKDSVHYRYGMHCQTIYKDRVAKVRTDTQLCAGEKAFIEKRKPKVKQALENLLGRKIEDDHVPTVAFVFSGGGYRSMIYTMGALCGAQDAGLLDTAMYTSGLSGSCWALGSWMSSDTSLKEHTESLITKMGWGINKITVAQATLIGKMLMLKYAYGQPISLVDMYGGLLANTLFAHYGDTRHFVYLSDQMQKINDGSRPFPLYSLVICDYHGTYYWAECTPCEFSCTGLEFSIPIWAMGRKFFNGVSFDFAPEQSLSTLFGVFGSAFTATFNRIYRDVKNKFMTGLTRKTMDALLSKFGGKRLIHGATLYNMIFGMDNRSICKQKNLYACDAGIDFNLGYPAVSGQHLKRKADVIVFVDASTTLVNSPDLKRIERYAQKYNLPFPKIDYTDINKKSVSVFKDEQNKTAPVVIYLPRIKDEKKWNAFKNDSHFLDHKEYLDEFDPEKCVWNNFGKTAKFMYTKNQAKTWYLLADFNMKASKPEILEAINWAIDNKLSLSRA